MLGSVLGSPASPREVLTAAKMLPSLPSVSDLRLRWSSARLGPPREGLGRALSRVHVESAAPSWWTANRMTSCPWSDHITPILPLKAISPAMSSEVTVLSLTGMRNGGVHVVSSVVEWAA